MQQSITIQKNPSLTGSSNYELLRKRGLEYIEQLSSSNWTDYNIHDPGITILELLCYAITDLGYRTSIDIKDLLAEPNSIDIAEALKRQAFFSAREALTINPWSKADFRKLLIDLEGIKNAWLSCKECACGDLILYAKCADSKLQYNEETGTHPVIVKGFYDVLLEFDNEQGLGDLNSGKVKYNFSFPLQEGGTSTAMIEMRLPTWQEVRQQPELYKDFNSPGNKITGIRIDKISDGENGTENVKDEKLANKIRRPLYVTGVSVDYERTSDPSSGDNVTFTNIPFSVWFKNDAGRRQIKLDNIKQSIENDKSVSGIFGKYLQLLHRADEVMQLAKNALLSHRNLCEDYCSINPVKVQEFAVCADIEVEPSADIEAVLAEVYYRIDQYMSADIKFYSLKQLIDAGVPVDEIFEGPQLSCGFINNEELESTNLKQFIYASDIINLLMDVPGVISISNFMLTKYNTAGFIGENNEWLMEVEHNHQPRLYIEASKILVFKNGLPFLPDRIELSDTLQVIRGRYAQPKFSLSESNLQIPEGNYHQLNDYYPLQYSLPFTYGVGIDGLPDSATVERKAQAKQLKGYLIFFEQMLLNYLEQLAAAKNLFALDVTVDKTYAGRLPGNDDIKQVDEIISGPGESGFRSLLESDQEFSDRRNRFLDHLLARFAENFNSYALMLNSYGSGRAVVQRKLQWDKIAFLKDFTVMSANRARAINYKAPAHAGNNENVAGLQLRIQRLLGMDGLGGFLEMFDVLDTEAKVVAIKWRLRDENGKVRLVSITNFISDKDFVAEEKARNEVLALKNYIIDTGRYKNTDAGFVINLADGMDTIIATNGKIFSSQAESDAMVGDIIAFGKKLLATDKVFVVEHLLLRPRNSPLNTFPEGVVKADPLLTICIPPGCHFCEGEEDPYSFRLTVVLSGETGITNKGIEFRRFAEQTIRKEVPAHLGVKICWVSNKQLVDFEIKYSAWLLQLAADTINEAVLQAALETLITEFTALKTVYPEATLHDCIDGNDENRVLLGHTAIISDEELDERIRNRNENNT